MGSATIPAFVMGSGLNGLGVVRSLGRRGIPTHVFGTPVDAHAFRSRYATPVPLSHPEDDEQVLAALVDAAGRTGQRPALVFTSDRDLELVSRHREALAEHFRLQVPTATAIDTVADKRRFAEFTQRHGFPVPATQVPQSEAEVVALAPTLDYPQLLKPARSHRWHALGFKVRRVEDADELVAQWRRLRDTADDLLVQEVIEGRDDDHYSYYSFRTRDRGEVLGVGVRKWRLTPIHGGVGAFAEVVRDDALADLGRRVLDALDYTGTASVCVKRDAHTGELKVYEVNGRLPQGHTATRIAGHDLPWVMYCHLAGLPEPERARPRRGAWVSLQLDVNALREYRRADELGLWAWAWSYRKVRTIAEVGPEDWGPLVGLLRTFVRRRARSR